MSANISKNESVSEEFCHTAYLKALAETGKKRTHLNGTRPLSWHMKDVL